MSGFIRQINSSDGAPITPPTTVKESVAKMVVFANDAAYEAIYGAGSQGDIYYNSTELLVREHNGTEWVYGQNGINALEDSTSTGSSQDLDPTYHNLIQVSNGSLTSVRSINDAQTSICYLVNATGNDILLLNEDGGAPSGEELMLPGAVNFTLEDGNVAHFVKDSITNAWRYTNAAGSGGGDGSGTGAKNYVLSPDSSTNVTDVGGSSSTDTTTLADLPEETKGVGVLVTQTAGSIGDTSTWETNAIDDGDGGRNGSAEMYWKTKTGYAGNAASIQWYNSDTSEILRSYDIPADSSGRISDYADSTVIMTAGENVKPRIYWNVTSETNGLVVSGAGTLAETRLTGGAGGWKQYDQSTVTFTTTLAGWSLNRAVFVPYKDPVTGIWRLKFNIDATGNTFTDSGASGVSIDGVTFKTGFSQTGSFESATAGNYGARMLVNGGNGVIRLIKEQTSTAFRVSGDVELDSKPTWADFDGSVMFGTEAQGQNAKLDANSSNGATINTGNAVIFENEIKSVAIDYDNTTGVSTILSGGEGDYFISSNTAITVAATWEIAVRKNGTAVKYGAVTTSGYGEVQALLPNLIAGDTVSIANVSGNTRTLLNNAAFNYLSIIRIADKSSKGTGFPFADQNPGEYGTVKAPNGTVVLDTGDSNDQGGSSSGDTAIRNFANSSVTGDAFTYTAQTTTTADFITVNRDCIAAITYYDRATSSGWAHGITINASNTSQSVTDVPVGERPAFQQNAANESGSIHATIKLSAGDIIRAHSNLSTTYTAIGRESFIVQEVYRLG